MYPNKNKCKFVTVSKKRRAFRQKLMRSLIFAAAIYLTGIAEREVEKYYARGELDLENMENEKLRHFFRLRCYEDFDRLFRALALPDIIRCKNNTTVSGRLGLAVVLRRLAYPNRWNDCIELLGRERTQLSRIYNSTIDLIYLKHGHLLNSLSQPWLSGERVAAYAAAVHKASGGIYDSCWGFIDGTARPICRPGLLQRVFYSGHCRGHVLKFQSIVTPDGLIANMWGPCEGSRHDGYMCRESRIRERLQLKNVMWGNEYCLFGDKGYCLSEEIQVPFKGPRLTPAQEHFNLEMSRCRLAVELGFQKICTLFAFGNYRENNKLYWQQTGKSFLVSAILANCLTCLYGFELIFQKFGVNPPLLEQYLRSAEHA